MEDDEMEGFQCSGFCPDLELIEDLENPEEVDSYTDSLEEDTNKLENNPQRNSSEISNLDFGDGTMRAVEDQKRKDEQQTSVKWKSSFPLFDQAIACMDFGLFFVGAMANAGKSIFSSSLTRGYLDNMPDAIGLYFCLDDSRPTFIRNFTAALGNIAIRDVALPKLLPDGSPKLSQRDDAYDKFQAHYGGRLAILDTDCLEHKAAYIETIVEYVQKVRDIIGPDRPLFVVVDAFDDIVVEKNFHDENREMKYKSTILKTLAKSTRSLIISTKHIVKNTHRGVGLDALSGTAKIQFDALVGSVSYNDVLVNGDNAEIYFNRDEVEDPERKYPVFELHIDKNKAGDFRGILSYFQFPEMSFCIECSEEEQRDFRRMIQEQVGKSNQRRRHDT